MTKQTINEYVSLAGRLAVVVLSVLVVALVLTQSPHTKPKPVDTTAADVEHGHWHGQDFQPTLEIPEFGPSGPPMGYQPNPDATEKFLKTLDKPYIRDAGPELFNPRGPPVGNDPQGVFLYRSLNRQWAKKYNKPWVVEQQKIGDCVSWGWAHAVAIHLAILCDLGHSSEFNFPCTEAIYGGSRVEARNLNGDGVSAQAGYCTKCYPPQFCKCGSNGSYAARFIRDFGIVWRREYSFADLRVYTEARAREYGAYGCGGRNDRGRADQVAKAFPVRTVALVRTFEEAAAAIRSGYPIPVCSLQGFRSQRNGDGFAAPSGTWAHCMCFIAVRADKPGLLCLNSWGPNWITGPKFPADMPDGSFWVDANTCNRMLAGGDSFAVSGMDGFPFQELNNGDWVQWQNTPAEAHYALAP